MKLSSLLDALSAYALDAAWLRAAVAPASDYGERAFSMREPFGPGEESDAAAYAERVASLARALDLPQLDALRDVFRNVPDATGAIARASMGERLNDASFLELQRFFDAVRSADAVASAAGLSPCANEALARCTQALELGRAGKFGFYLDDAFDKTLAKVRDALTQAQAEYDAVRGRTAVRVAAALGREELGGNEFIVMRADLRGQLPPGVRVVREAPTYVLCELDADEATLAALERRDAAATAVATAEEAVRSRLSEAIRADAAALDAAANAFGELDVLTAAARFARVHACIAAEYAAQPVLDVVQARFLPLEAELRDANRTFTAIDVALDDVAVLTGPNMGGKSVCLRTTGFIALCAAFGLPVPAARARVGLFDEIAWLGVGADDDGGGLLSSFAREVVRLREVIDRKPARLFALFDEFARTTTPREGKALLVAVLERLREGAVCGLAATHLAGVAQAAGVRHFAVRGLRGIPDRPSTGDLRQALAALGASMDYTIEEVTDERVRPSDAIALASLLGLDDDITRAAYDALE